jgi:putative lipase involved disintegration of autophagic bodies
MVHVNLENKKGYQSKFEENIPRFTFDVSESVLSVDPTEKTTILTFAEMAQAAYEPTAYVEHEMTEFEIEDDESEDEMKNEYDEYHDDEYHNNEYHNDEYHNDEYHNNEYHDDEYHNNEYHEYHEYQNQHKKLYKNEYKRKNLKRTKGMYDANGNVYYQLNKLNNSEGFGWNSTFLRGYIFKSEESPLVIIAFKGTSILGDPTAGNDKFADSSLFSCCCAHVNSRWSDVCPCFTGNKTSFKCNKQCLADNYKNPQAPGRMSYYTLALVRTRNVKLYSRVLFNGRLKKIHLLKLSLQDIHLVVL